MADKAEDEVVDEVVLDDDATAAAEAAEAEAFEAGYEGKPTEPAPPVDTDDDADKKDGDPDGEKKEEEAPKYRQITEDEYAELKALSTQIEAIRAENTKRFDTAFGKVGGVERKLAELQAATPAGHTVEVTDDVVAELKGEFPELGTLVEKAFKNLAGKMKGTAPTALDPDQIGKAVVTQLVAQQIETLEEDHPDWREVVGAPDSNNAYRQWLAAQPADYQARLASTNSATVIGKSITKFEADKAKADTAAAAEKAKADAAEAAAKKDSARRQRLAGAATVRGAGGHSAASAEDPFEDGFKNG